MTTTKQIRRIGSTPRNECPEPESRWQPTPEQIAAGCAEIQKTWTEREFWRRGRGTRAELGIATGRIVDVDELM